MVKSNISFGGKLLLIILTIVIYTLVVVGAIAGIGYYAYKKVKVRDLANFVGADGWISENYDGTIETLVNDVLADISSGEITIDSLIEISPKLGEKLDSVISNVENVGLFKVDTAALYSTPVSEITSSMSDVLVVTATLSDLSETFGFDLPPLNMISGSEETPVYFYAQVNEQNEDGTFTEIGKTFAMSDGAFSYYTRTPVYLSEFEQDGEKVPVVQSVIKNLYDLAGVQEENGYLTLSGQTLYIGTVSESGEISAQFERLTGSSAAVWQKPSKENTDYTFALAENQGIYTVRGPATGAGGEIADGSGYAFEKVALTPDAENPTVAVREIALQYKYTPLYAYVGGEYVPANEMQDGEYVIADGGGYAIDGEFIDETQLYYLTYDDSEPMDYAAAAEAAKTQAVFVKTNGIAALPLVQAMDALSAVMDMQTLTLADFELYFGVQVSGNAALEQMMYVPLGRLGDGMSEEISNVYLKDVLSIQADSPYALIRLAYGNGYQTDGDGNIVSDENGQIVVADESQLKTIGDLAPGFDSLVISDFVEINEDSANLLKAIGDWTLNDLSNKEKFESLSLGELLNLEEGTSAKILLALKDVPIGEIGQAANDIALGDMLDIDESDTLLFSLKNSTLGTLADDVAELSVQQLFSDSIYEQDRAGTLKDIGTLADTYGAENLYLRGAGGYFAYTQYTQEELAGMDENTAIYSPYTVVYDEGQGINLIGSYGGIPLYYLNTEGDAPKMALATATTGWALPDESSLPEGVSEYYIKNEDGSYSPAAADGNLYRTDTLWYFEKGAEQMKKLALVPAEYGISEDFLNSDGTPNVRLFTKLKTAETGTPADGSAAGETYYTSGNLFYFDAASQSWKQVKTQGVYTAGEDGETQIPVKDSGGNMLYTIADGETVPAGATLYTYGLVTGTWKYLLLDSGAEQMCKLQNVNSLVTNVSANIRTATIRGLLEDGLININPIQVSVDNEVVTIAPEDMLDIKFTFDGETTEAFGDMTIGRFIEIAFRGLASGNHIILPQ